MHGVSQNRYNVSKETSPIRYMSTVGYNIYRGPCSPLFHWPRPYILLYAAWSIHRNPIPSRRPQIWLPQNLVQFETKLAWCRVLLNLLLQIIVVANGKDCYSVPIGYRIHSIVFSLALPTARFSYADIMTNYAAFVFALIYKQFIDTISIVQSTLLDCYFLFWNISNR